MDFSNFFYKFIIEICYFQNQSYKVESNQIFKDSANIYMDNIFITTYIIKRIGQLKIVGKMFLKQIDNACDIESDDKV